MAILINKDVTVLGGLTTNQLYLRLSYNVDVSGKIVRCKVQPYFSKEAFLLNEHLNNIQIPEIKTPYHLTYDAETDGNLLTFLHNNVKENLINDEMGPIPVLDAFDKFTYDDDGDLITETGIVKPKYAEEDEVTFVDLD